MARNDKPTPLGIETEEMTPEARYAQMMQEAEARIAKMEQEAAEKMQRADKALADAAKATAGIKLNTTNMSYNRDVAEAAKLTMQKRAERQFGTEGWITFVCPVPNGFHIGDVLHCGVNGYCYDLACGTEYTLPREVKEIAYGYVK